MLNVTIYKFYLAVDCFYKNSKNIINTVYKVYLCTLLVDFPVYPHQAQQRHGHQPVYRKDLRKLNHSELIPYGQYIR